MAENMESGSTSPYMIIFGLCIILGIIGILVNLPYFFYFSDVSGWLNFNVGAPVDILPTFSLNLLISFLLIVVSVAGIHLMKTEEKQHRAPVRIDVQTKYCRQCEKSNDLDAAFCTNCGAKF